MPELPQPFKPRLRGAFHQWACAASVPLGLVLLIVRGPARPDCVQRLRGSLVALFGVSALYRRIARAR